MIVKFYRDATESVLPRWTPVTSDSPAWTLQMEPHGLGDAIMLSSLPTIAKRCGRNIRVWSTSKHYDVLKHFIDGPILKDQGAHVIDMLAADRLFNVGSGHLLQRAARLFGLRPDPLPVGYLKLAPVKSKHIRCSVHLGAGECQAWQKKLYHPRAREIYPENIAIIRQFIASHSEIEFAEVGTDVLRDIIPSVGRSGLKETIQWMGTAHVHIGPISGPYHLAHLMGARTIAIINFPEPWRLMLPSLKNCGVVEEQWLYPQSSILHQDHDSAHWPKFSLFNLEAAFNGEVYPYGNPIPLHDTNG